MADTSLSIIIPIYKIESEETFPFFHELILSIRNSFSGDLTLDCLMEIIVVNDYPLIDSRNKVRNVFESAGLGKKLNYIKLDENRGQAFARNTGAQKARGSYIHFIDQDDLISPDFYTKLLTDNKKADVLMGNIFITGKTHTPYQYFRQHTLRLYEGAKNLYQLRYILISNIAVSPGQYLISKKVFDLSGGFPDLTNKGSDDFGMMFKLSAKKISFLFDRHAVFFYRLHKDQSRNNLSIKNSVSEFFARFAESTDLSFRLIAMIKKCSLKLPVIGKCFFFFFFNRK